MSCRLCKKLKLKTIRELNEKLLSGEQSLVELSTTYKVPLKYLNRHMTKCLGGGPKSGHATLQDLLAKVLKDLKDARNDYKYGGGDEDGNVDKGVAFFYSSLLKEARELVLSINKLEPNEEIVARITIQVVTPFLNEMVRILLEEGNGLKTELQTLLGSSYDKKTDVAVKEAWKRIAIRFKLEAGKINPKLDELFPSQDAATAKKGSARESSLSLVPAIAKPQVL